MFARHYSKGDDTKIWTRRVLTLISSGALDPGTVVSKTWRTFR